MVLFTVIIILVMAIVGVERGIDIYLERLAKKHEEQSLNFTALEAFNLATENDLVSIEQIIWDIERASRARQKSILRQHSVISDKTYFALLDLGYKVDTSDEQVKVSWWHL